MYPQLELEEALARQLNEIRKKYRREIEVLEKNRQNRDNLYAQILKLQFKASLRNNYLNMIPLYFILKRDFNLAWTVTLYLKPSWEGNLEVKNEIENPELNTGQPLSEPANVNEIAKGIHTFLPAFSFDDQYYNDILYKTYLEKAHWAGHHGYDVSPKCRYLKTADEFFYYLSYLTESPLREILAMAFRQERYEVVRELLFRLKYMLSTGEVPTYMSECAKRRHLVPFLYMYDSWFQARFASDEVQRRELAREALYWCVETAIRSAGNEWTSSLFSLFNVFELIGEFDLMGEQQEEFLRNFKRWTLYASISFYKKIQANPIQIIPFSERNAPSYDEVKAMYEEMKKKMEDKKKK